MVSRLLDLSLVSWCGSLHSYMGGLEPSHDPAETALATMLGKARAWAQVHEGRGALGSSLCKPGASESQG